MSEPERNKILRRARKLRALAQSTNENEAESACEQLRKLKAEHDIDDAELTNAEEAQVAEWPVEGVNFSDDWRMALLTVIAKRYGCRTLRYFWKEDQNSGVIVAPKDTAEIIEKLFRYFDGEVSTLCTFHWEMRLKFLRDMRMVAAAEDKELSSDASRAEFEEWMGDYAKRRCDGFSDSFCRGATIALQDRILSGELDATAICDAPQKETETPQALVSTPPKAVAKRLVDEYVKFKVVPERTRWNGVISDEDAFFLGKTEGARMPLMKEAPKEISADASQEAR